MKKIFCLLALAVAAALPVRATQYYFDNFEVVIDGASSLSLQLGSFHAGFTPGAGNTSNWLSNWISSPDVGYYDGSGPEWSVNLGLADNSGIAVGQQIFLWAFDTQAGVGSQWALFQDAAWTMEANDGLDPTTYFLAFSENTTALLGSLDLAKGLATTNAVGAGSSVPDASASVLLFAAGLATVVGVRRRMQTVAA